MSMMRKAGLALALLAGTALGAHAQSSTSMGIGGTGAAGSQSGRTPSAGAPATPNVPATTLGSGARATQGGASSNAMGMGGSTARPAPGTAGTTGPGRSTQMPGQNR
ncbi:MAG TPA: hypothetical protein VIL69_02755 [Roseomonas sp.]|jgi:hypothetical protein